jgi:hypothetical protein
MYQLAEAGHFCCRNQAPLFFILGSETIPKEPGLVKLLLP